MNRFLKRYENREIEVRRKVSLFFSILLSTLLVDLILLITMTVSGGAVSLQIATAVLLVLLLGQMAILYAGFFNLASGFFALSLLLAVGGGILFDRVDSLFEIYMFTTAAFFLMIALNLISTQSLGIWMVAVTALALVWYHFFSVSVPAHGGPSGHLIRNLILSTGFTLLALIASLASLRLHRTLRRIILNDREEAEKMLRITEVYTKKSLINIIRGGQDPTTYLPMGQDFCILFNDIRNFTALSERMGPRETVSFLNTYFDRMNEIIQQNGGEIDKLIGDCIMASMITPEDSLRCAMGIHRELSAYNAELYKKGEPLVHSGTGIAYGEVVQGNIGSLGKMDYTIIGEVVNAASRLENLTKYYRVNCLISDQIYDNLPPGCSESIRRLDTVYLKGSRQPMKIYEVYSHEPKKIIRLKKDLQQPLEEAFEVYRQGSFEKAQRMYERLIKEVGPHQYLPDTCADPALHYLAARASILAEQKEAGLLDHESWDGVYQFMKK